MRILVTGGTGKVGRATLAALREAGAALRDAGRDAVPASRSGEGGVALDLRDAGAVEASARGFDAALLVTPVGPDEEAIGFTAAEALVRAGVRRIVAIGIHNVEAMREIPHFAAKLPMRRAVLAAGGTVLDCNFFQENDLLVLAAILHGGVFPLPIGSAGVYPVSVADIGRAAANALSSDDWAGQAVPVCGPDRLTGADYAADWSAALGRPVAYGGDDIDPFIDAMRAMPAFDEWFEHDFRTMMRVTQAQGCPATPQDVARAQAIVGRPLTRHMDFARRAAAGQTGESA